MVQEICRDIKKLDYAKKHLTSTITALRQLGMLGELFRFRGEEPLASAPFVSHMKLSGRIALTLCVFPPLPLPLLAPAVTAVDQLEVMANKKQYRDAANLLEARPAPCRWRSCPRDCYAKAHGRKLNPPRSM